MSSPLRICQAEQPLPDAGDPLCVPLALGFSGIVVGRTGAVGGSLVISGDRVTRAAFRIDLRTVKVGGKTQAQFASSVATAEHPVAVFTLARPAVLAPAFTSGGVVTVTATGHLAMHGTSRLVTVTLSTGNLLVSEPCCNPPGAAGGRMRPRFRPDALAGESDPGPGRVRVPA